MSSHGIVHLNHRHASKNLDWTISEEDYDVDLPFGISGTKFGDLALGCIRGIAPSQVVRGKTPDSGR
jgi:hypothetical protein